MSRPYYCSAQDNANEAQVLDVLLARLNRDSVQFNQGRSYSVKHAGGSKHNPYDGEVYCNGKLFALVEIKRRNGQSDRYADWHMSAMKIARNMDAAKSKNVPLFLVYKWDDGVFMANAASLDLSRSHISGRWDRGDAHDEEKMVLMDRNQFKRV